MDDDQLVKGDLKYTRSKAAKALNGKTLASPTPVYDEAKTGMTSEYQFLGYQLWKSALIEPFHLSK